MKDRIDRLVVDKALHRDRFVRFGTKPLDLGRIERKITVLRHLITGNDRVGFDQSMLRANLLLPDPFAAITMQLVQGDVGFRAGRRECLNGDSQLMDLKKTLPFGSSRRDRDTRPLEKSLNSFLAGVVRIAERIKVKRAKREVWLRKCEEEAAQRREQERRRQEEDLRLVNLQKGCKQWMKAENLRHYIDAVRIRAIEMHGVIEPSSDIHGWIQWAEQQADAIDPLVGNTSLPSYAVPVEPQSR